MTSIRISPAVVNIRRPGSICRRLVCLAAATMLIAAAALPSAACQIPVFRYALERWRPDPYEAIVIFDGELTDEQLGLVDRLSNAQFDEKAPLNLVVRKVNVQETKPEQAEELYKRTSKPESLPWLVLDYPFNSQTPGAAWAGPLTDDNLAALFDSPVRQKILKRLLAGDSAVWVLLECGDKKKDDAAAAMISEQLKANQDELKLPEQDVIQNDEFFQAETSVPLRLAFSMIRLSRDDAAERVLVKIIGNAEKELPDDEPIAVPVFGRGRSYFAMVGKGINEENIASDCGFLTGPCSCRVKAENPGVDFLFAVDWDRHITETPVKEIELPELSGVAALAAAAEKAKSDPPASPDPSTETPDEPSDPASADAIQDPAPTAAGQPSDDAEKLDANNDANTNEPNNPETSIKDQATSDRAETDKSEVAFAGADAGGDAETPSAKYDQMTTDEREADSQSTFSDVNDRKQLPLWMPIAAVTFFGALIVVFGTVIVKLRSH